jgi:AP-2 complex subunit beta-1
MDVQGKVAELRTELASAGKKDKNHAQKKVTMKKIVANMTMSNNDMVALFPEIVETMKLPSLEIKKMYAANIMQGTTNSEGASSSLSTMPEQSQNTLSNASQQCCGYVAIYVR